MFYTLGRGRGGNVFVYALKLKQFVFSNEIIQTGKQEIDSQAFDNYSRTRLPVPTTGTGKFIPGEIIYQGTDSANAIAQAVVHSYNAARYVDVVWVKGDFISGQPLKGADSGAVWTLSGQENNLITTSTVFEDIQDNQVLETEGSSIIDFTETNPFGEP